MELGYYRFTSNEGRAPQWACLGNTLVRQKQIKFRSFHDARDFSHKLNLTSNAAWVEFCTSGKRPSDIPSNPQLKYGLEWQGWRDWLGTGQTRNATSKRYKFRSFEEARGFARELGLPSTTEWRAYCAGPERPRDIPTNPNIAFRDQWKGWGDWLGTGNTKNSFLPFDEARRITRSFGLRTMAQYYDAVRSRVLPHGVPKDPRAAYLNSGWQNWGDWLGTFNLSTTEKRRNLRPFAEAAEFAKSLGLRSKTEWFQWTKSGNRPDDIPANPADSYQGDGWLGWAHFLGTKNKKAGEIAYRDFTAAREWARSQRLQLQAEWELLVASGRLPVDIPAKPMHVYREKGWTTIGDWLGKGERHSKNRKWRNFAEARDYIRAQGLRSWADFVALCETGGLPDIPAQPQRVYRDAGWISRGDWLATNTVASSKRHFLSFEKAREFARTLGFHTKTEYEAWARRAERPSDIPALPSRTYARTGWLGWGDWLGAYKRWNKTSILAFVMSIAPLLNRLQPSEIYAILRQNGCLNAVDSLADTSPLKQLVRAALHQDREGIEHSLRDLGLEELDDAEILVSPDGPTKDEIAETVISLEENETRLPDLGPVDILSALDDLERSVILSDTETIEFLITKAVGRLWSRLLRSENTEWDLAELQSHSPGSYSSRVRGRFLAQFNGANALAIPIDYAFRKKGEPLPPNLMQRLIAYRVANDGRVGNWSGTGAGKTLGAILASRTLGAKLTVIVALNNSMLDFHSGWAAEILNAFPKSHVIIKERGTLTLDAATPNYLLLNYEAFQQPDSQTFVKALIREHKIDFIVLDEVHSAKSRGQVESKRRQLINYLLVEAAKVNADMRVLAMSATPVINSLDEAVSLLEMVTGHEYPDLATRPKVSSALAIHEQLVIHGVRYIPRYEMELHERHVEILAPELAESLQSVGKGQVLAIETILTDAKLDTIAELSKPGTLIYSQFVEFDLSDDP